MFPRGPPEGPDRQQRPWNPPPPHPPTPSDDRERQRDEPYARQPLWIIVGPSMISGGRLDTSVKECTSDISRSTLLFLPAPPPFIHPSIPPSLHPSIHPHSHPRPFLVRFGLVYWGLTPQQQPGPYQGGEMMMKSVFWWRKPEYPEETTDLLVRKITSDSVDVWICIRRFTVNCRK